MDYWMDASSRGRKPSIGSALTQKQVEDVFAQCDEGDGFISIKRLKIVMRALGLEPRQYEVERLTKKMIENSVARTVNAYSFSLEELIYILGDKLREKEDDGNDLSSIFRLFDIDGKGAITIDDLRRIVDELGEHLKDEELQEMIREADFSRCGHVNETDFRKVMKKTGLY